MEVPARSAALSLPFKVSALWLLPLQMMLVFGASIRIDFVQLPSRLRLLDNGNEGLR